jgi:hypothetical protein
MEPSVEQVLSYRNAGEKRPPVRRKARTVLLILIVLLGTAVLMVLGPSFLFLAAVAFNSTIDEREARADVATLTGGAGKTPASLQIVKAVRDDGFGDSSQWYKLRVNPAEMDAFKDNVRRALERQTPDAVKEADTIDTIPFDAPRWWRPRDLPDAELLHDHYHWLVFSRRTGTVYVLTFTT